MVHSAALLVECCCAWCLWCVARNVGGLRKPWSACHSLNVLIILCGMKRKFCHDASLNM